MASKKSASRLRLVAGGQEAVDPALLSELRAAFAAQEDAQRALAAVNEEGERLRVLFTERSAVTKHVYAKVALQHKLGEADGIDVTTGIVRRRHFAVPPSGGA
ncbi:MAG: hypothetical protein WC729_29995 [Sphingomonas sp.]|jgi:hypothetical protein|uniref:hypothetical protein n=1 Tax=Sphingomonas sp. TaxID=28214 RepID=UPI003568E175